MADRIFSDRGKAHEAAFSAGHDAQFRLTARRNRLAANWAAGLIGRDGDADYIREVMASDFIEAGDADLIGKLMDDFRAAGVDMDEATIQAKLQQFHLEAAQAPEAG